MDVARVTVLVAVYNGTPHVRDAVDSILRQTFHPFELLIVDDGSIDETFDVLRAYRDPRVRILRNPRNIGLAASLNRGLRHAEGSIVARQDADDISEPDRLAVQVAFLDRHADVGLVGSAYHEIDAAGTIRATRSLPCDDTDLRWAMLFYCPFVHSATMFRTNVIGRVGPYDESFRYSMDYELWRRIARVARVANVAEPLVRWRQHSASMTSTYGAVTREGVRLRVEMLSELLGWHGGFEDRERALTRMQAIVVGTRVEATAHELARAADDLRRLHSAFCLHHGLAPETCRSHGRALRHELRQRLMAAARRAVQQGELRDGSALALAALRTCAA